MADLQAFYFQRNRDYLNGALGGLYLNGIYTAILGITVFNIVVNRGWRQLLRPLHVVMLVVYALCVVHCAYNWNLLDYGFKNSETFESMTAAFARIRSSIAGRLYKPITANFNLFLQDAVMVWRCWVIWQKSWKVACVPAFLVGCQLFMTVWIVVTRGLDKQVGTFDGMVSTLVNISISLATTIIVTILIIVRILSLGSFRRYHTVVETVVESAVMYAITLIVYVPFLLSETRTDIIAGAVLQQIGGIALTLVVARVSAGNAVATDVTNTWPTAFSSSRFQSHDMRGREQHAIATVELERTGTLPSTNDNEHSGTKCDEEGKPRIFEKESSPQPC